VIQTFLQCHLFKLNLRFYRSALLLPSRGAAFPAIPVDTSALVAEETALRRKMHEEVLRENPDAFRR
jgi:hypothetical protein